MLLKKRVKSYCDTLNDYFASCSMDWQIFADSTFGDMEELLKGDYEMFVFRPGGETRFWIYDKEIKASKIPMYYLTEKGFYEKDVSKLLQTISVD